MIRPQRALALAVGLAVGLAAAGCGQGEEAKAGGDQVAADAIPKGDAGRRLYFEKRCKEGHFGLCSELGLMWERGWGGPKDKAKADAYYKIGCDNAVVDSCIALGQDFPPEKELELLAKNCAAGSPFACNNQGQLLLTGTNVTADPVKARPLLEKGCAGGFPSSCRGLANIWGIGLGVEKDPAKKKQYEEKAAALQAAVDAEEAKYLHRPPRDQLPVGHASEDLVKSVRGDSAEQDEMNKKLIEAAAQRLKGILGADAGAPPPKP